MKMFLFKTLVACTAFFLAVKSAIQYKDSAEYFLSLMDDLSMLLFKLSKLDWELDDAGKYKT